MQAHFLSSSTILLLLFPLVTSLWAADEISTNFLQTTAQDWGKGDGMSLQLEEKNLRIESADPPSPHSWVAPQLKLPYTPQTKLEAKVKEVIRGGLVVQVEWLDAQGQFLASAAALEVKPGEDAKADLTLAELNPPANTKQLQLKIWLNGQDAVAEIDVLEIKLPLAWRQGGVTTKMAYDGSSTLSEESEGLVTQVQGENLDLQLKEGVDHASFLFPDRVEYAATDAVMLYLPSLVGGNMTVQAVCWDAKGNYLKSVDLFKDVAKSGVYEVPFSIYADQVPEATRQVSFKVWLMGQKASASLARLLVGQKG